MEGGIDHNKKIKRQRPVFVRPPYWLFNDETVVQYETQGLHMLLSDVKMYDGVNWGMHVFRRPNVRAELRRVLRKNLRRRLPAVKEYAPIVVTFHDTNAYTARHLEEYLHILVEEAQRLRLPLHNKPFYDSASEITAAALRRVVHSVRQQASVCARQ